MGYEGKHNESGRVILQILSPFFCICKAAALATEAKRTNISIAIVISLSVKPKLNSSMLGKHD